MSAEEWRPFGAGHYEASSLGRIRRATDGVNTRAGRVKALQVNANGYAWTTVFDNGSRDGRTVFAHRAVAEAFHGPCPAGMQVNHIDGDKRNNSPSNLEYVTAKQNTAHAHRLGLMRPAREKPSIRGDAHWTRRNPGRLARGDVNGARLHPERILHGDASPSSALTEDDVRAIRARVAAGESYSALGRAYGVTHQTIRYAALRLTWRHVE